MFVLAHIADLVALVPLAAVMAWLGWTRVRDRLRRRSEGNEAPREQGSP